MVAEPPLCDDEAEMDTDLRAREASAPPRPRRAFRMPEQAILGGVAEGLAHHTGWPVTWVRFGFVISTAIGGLGAIVYAAYWLLLPAAPASRPEAPGLESARRDGRRPGRVGRLRDAGPVLALGALGIGALLLIQALIGNTSAFWPLALAGVGLALVWRQADEAQRERWTDASGRVHPMRLLFGGGGWAAYARVLVGVGLVIAALVTFSLRAGTPTLALDVVIAGLLGVLGLALVIGPWVVRLTGDLTMERAERLRSQDRADLAAHLHDSVLQTLALIQKNAGDAGMVARLARAQERDLRSWLFEEANDPAGSLVAALREAAAAVEDAFGPQVDVVAVGDCALGENLQPLVAAAREAMTNAAKHAGTPRVDVYAEITEAEATVFVRDRGPGFALDEIADDRQGIRSSIVGRMERHHGTAEIRSAPGGGTEVRLRLPRTDKEI